MPAILQPTLDFRYLAIDGPIGAGKTGLAERLGAWLDATVVLDETENPFFADFCAERPGAAFQTQLFFLLARHRQQVALRQAHLFSQVTICDYVFDKDKIYAFLNLDDNELYIYQRLYDLLSPEVPAPDLVVYLQAPIELIRRRLKARGRREPELPRPDDRYLQEVSEAYNHFYFHYSATPLLVVETSHLDLTWDDETLDRLLGQIREMGRGTRYYVLRDR